MQVLDKTDIYGKKKGFLNPLVIVKSKECKTTVHNGFNC